MNLSIVQSYLKRLLMISSIWLRVYTLTDIRLFAQSLLERRKIRPYVMSAVLYGMTKEILMLLQCLKMPSYLLLALFMHFTLSSLTDIHILRCSFDIVLNPEHEESLFNSS